MFKKLRNKFQEFVEEEKQLAVDPSLETKIKKKVKRKAEIKEKDIKELTEDLYLSLLSSDVSMPVAEEIRDQIKERILEEEVKSGETIGGVTKEKIREILAEHLLEPEEYIHESVEKSQEPYILLVIGPNGHGKTTTIAKIAKKLQEQGEDVVLAAADTFRAASIEQITKWSEKLDTKLIKHDYGSDPAAVCYDAKEHAEANDKDAVIIDTAGRSELDKNLMQQLKKIKEVVNPDCSLYITEAVAGNSAVEQAKEFDSKVGLDGFTITKTDTDAKGGCLLSLSSEVEEPIQYIGTGQDLEDLEEFKKEWFLNKIIPED